MNWVSFKELLHNINLPIPTINTTHVLELEVIQITIEIQRVITNSTKHNTEQQTRFLRKAQLGINLQHTIEANREVGSGNEYLHTKIQKCLLYKPLAS